MKKKGVLIILAGVAVVVAAAASVTVTAQDEYKLVRRFGKELVSGFLSWKARRPFPKKPYYMTWLLQM